MGPWHCQEREDRRRSAGGGSHPAAHPLCSIIWLRSTVHGCASGSILQRRAIVHSQASHLLIKLTPVTLRARALKCSSAKRRRFPLHHKHAHTLYFLSAVSQRCHFEAERLTADLLHTSVSRGGLGLFITCSQLVKSCTAEGLSSRL